MPKKPKRPLSEKPTAVRSRMRRTAENIERDIGMLYEKAIEDWDMEELAKGRPRSKDGTFRGPRPLWITPIILKQAQDRLRLLTRQQMSEYATDAIKVIVDLMKEDGTDFDGKPLVPASTRLSAATYVMDQLIGKATNPVEVTGNVVLSTLMAQVLVNDDEGTLAHPIIEGQVVGDDEDSPQGE